MSEPLNPDEQKIYDDINSALTDTTVGATSFSEEVGLAAVSTILPGIGSSIANAYRGVKAYEAGTEYFSTAAEKLSREIDKLDQLNKKDKLTEEEKKERDEIFQSLKNISTALGEGDDFEKARILTGGDPLSDPNVPEAIVNLDKINSATRPGDFQKVELQDVDPNDPTIFRGSLQCFLLYNIDFMAQYHKNFLLDGARIPDSERLAPDGDPSLEISNYGYRKPNDEPRIYLMSEDTDSTIVNNKLNYCTGNEQFAKIKTNQYAQLQPLLRLYKVYRNHEGSGIDRMVEIEFRNKTGLEGIVGYTSASQPDGTESSVFSKGTECGVKSFDWKLVGTDPFTATRDIEATLILHAQHFTALSKTREGKNLLSENRAEDLKYKYLDLVVQPNCTEKPGSEQKQEYDRIYNPGCYEIRVDVGYASQNGVLKDQICCQQDTLYLVHVDHQFEFNEDGTMNLTISYRGRLETIMNDKKFNVLLPGGGFVDKQLPKQGTALLLNIYNSVEESIKKAKADEDEKRLKKLERAREAILLDLRQFMYSLIMETLEDKGLIHSVRMPEDHFYRFIRWKDPAAAEHLELPPKLSITTSVVSSGAENNVAIQYQAANADYAQNPEDFKQQTVIDRISDLTARQTLDRIEKSNENSGTRQVNFIYLGDLIAIVLSNVLGELELPAGIASNTSITGLGAEFQARTRALANFSFTQQSIDYLADKFGIYSDSVTQFGIYDQGQTEQEIVPGATITPTIGITKVITDRTHLILGNLDIADEIGQQKFVNLAHIPISVESFQEFMLKNVISQNLSYYSLTEFFDDVVNNLITNMFNNDCLGGLVETDSRTSMNLFQSKIPINPSIYRIPDSGPGTELVAYKQLVLSDIATSGSQGFVLPFGRDAKCSDLQGESHQYFVFNTLNTHPKNLAGTLTPGVRGDPRGDRTRGIVHFTYGEDRGLLKKVTFTKTDQEYLPEMRFSSGDGSVLNQLSNFYNANFEMLGNNIFKPGQLLYFNPEPIGVGSPWQFAKDSRGGTKLRSWSNIMGIGGYHLVTQVAHSIGPGKYFTSVTARWVTSGEDIEARNKAQREREAREAEEITQQEETAPAEPSAERPDDEAGGGGGNIQAQLSFDPN